MSKRKPLTLEELRDMPGKPVWIERNDPPHDGKWDLVDYADTEHPDKTLYTKSGVTYSEYGKYFTAYAYEPPRLDRSAWEPCGACKTEKIIIHVPAFKAMAVCNQHMDHGAFDLTLHLNFCPYCGRPMTDAAWDMWERRFGHEHQ